MSQCAFGTKVNCGFSPHCRTITFPDSSGPIGVSADGIFGIFISNETNSFSITTCVSSAVFNSFLSNVPPSKSRDSCATFRLRFISLMSPAIFLRSSASFKIRSRSIPSRFLFLIASRTRSGLSRMKCMSSMTYSIPHMAVWQKRVFKLVQYFGDRLCSCRIRAHGFSYTNHWPQRFSSFVARNSRYAKGITYPRHFAGVAICVPMHCWLASHDPVWCTHSFKTYVRSDSSSYRDSVRPSMGHRRECA